MVTHPVVGAARLEGVPEREHGQRGVPARGAAVDGQPLPVHLAGFYLQKHRLRLD